MRLFAAIRPPQEVLDHLQGVLADLDEPQLRWMPAHQLHLTLAFYGEVDRDRAEEVRAYLGDELGGAGGLELQLGASGTFGQRVLWVGVGGETERLQQLMTTAAGAPGHVQEHAPHPHVTIARARRHHKEDLDAPARQLAGYAGPHWWAGSIEVIVSHLGRGPGGVPAHEVMATVDL